MLVLNVARNYVIIAGAPLSQFSLVLKSTMSYST